jgi:uncharacterized membrane protein YfcA
MLEYWWLMPLGAVINAFATTVGIGGAVFFAPIFILGLGMPPLEAFGTALAIQVFGFGAGTYGYARRGKIDFHLSEYLLLAAVPGAVIGALIAGFFPQNMLKLMMGAWLLFFAFYLYRRKNEELNLLDIEHIGLDPFRLIGLFASFVGGMLIGLISTGIGSTLILYLNTWLKMPIKQTLGTTMFVTFVTVFFAVLIYAGTAQVNYSVILFAAPGVVIGGMIGPQLTKRINALALIGIISLVFGALGVAMIWSVLH